MTRFSKLDPDGTESKVRVIPQSALRNCPHYILVADHYRENNTCRCDDPADPDMKGWGYHWSEKNKRWE